MTDPDVTESPPLETKKSEEVEPLEPEREPLEQKRKSLSGLFACSLCLEEKRHSDRITLVGCSHGCCASCFTRYLRAHLKDQSKYPLICFTPDCKTVIDYSDIKLGLSTEEVAIYDKFLLRVNILGEKDRQTLYCPLPKCETMMIFSSSDLEIALKTCTGCKREFCCKCLTVWHAGKTCEQVKKEDGGEQTRIENLAMFKQLAKQERWLPCPVCGQVIERTGGCHHMSHFRSQGCATKEEATHFCALCSMVLGGKYHKSEPNGALHFPEGLFKACRVAAKLIAEGKMEPLPPPDPHDIPPGQDLLDQLQGGVPAPGGGPDMGRRWNISLCGCLSEPSDYCTCFKGCCCPCYLAGEVEEMLPLLQMGGKYKICCFYCCCWCFIAPYKRYKIRRLFNIRGLCCIDFCVSNLFPCCAVIQERGELLRRAGGPDVQAMI